MPVTILTRGMIKGLYLWSELFLTKNLQSLTPIFAGFPHRSPRAQGPTKLLPVYRIPFLTSTLCTHGALLRMSLPAV